MAAFVFWILPGLFITGFAYASMTDEEQNKALQYCWFNIPVGVLLWPAVLGILVYEAYFTREG